MPFKKAIARALNHEGSNFNIFLADVTSMTIKYDWFFDNFIGLGIESLTWCLLSLTNLPLISKTLIEIKPLAPLIFRFALIKFALKEFLLFLSQQPVCRKILSLLICYEICDIVCRVLYLFVCLFLLKIIYHETFYFPFCGRFFIIWM